MLAWTRIARVRLKAWERRALLKMDEAYLLAAQPAKGEPEEPLGPVLTPEIFKATFDG